MTAETPEQSLAQDWITLWHSEWSAIALDREAAEQARAMMALWAGFADAMAQGSAALDRGPAGSAAPSRTQAAAAASDAGRDARIVAALDRLGERIAAIEQRLAGLAGDLGGGVSR